LIVKRNLFVEATSTLFNKNSFLGPGLSETMKIIDSNQNSTSTELT